MVEARRERVTLLVVDRKLDPFGSELLERFRHAAVEGAGTLQPVEAVADEVGQGLDQLPSAGAVRIGHLGQALAVLEPPPDPGQIEANHSQHLTAVADHFTADPVAVEPLGPLGSGPGSELLPGFARLAPGQVAGVNQGVQPAIEVGNHLGRSRATSQVTRSRLGGQRRGDAPERERRPERGNLDRTDVYGSDAHVESPSLVALGSSGQRDGHGRPLPLPAFDCDRAAEGGDDLADDGEPEAEAIALAFREPHPWVTGQLFESISSDPNARVAHGHRNDPPTLSAPREFDDTAAGCMPEGVVDEIAEHLSQPVVVDQDVESWRRRRSQVDAPLRRQRREPSPDTLERRYHVNRNRVEHGLPRLQSRKIEKTSHESAHPGGFGLDGLQRPLALAWGLGDPVAKCSSVP